jgi:TetR/AcrR family transcriptional regulator
MSDDQHQPADHDDETDGPAVRPKRTRPAPGQRRLEILQALATMLETPSSERITTAALAKRLSVSEAALYRHFASKAQMLEGLIGFIEDSILGLVHQVQERESDALTRCHRMVALVLQFGEANPGMARVIVGDALLYEHTRLQERMDLLMDKLESALRQEWREVATQGGDPTPTLSAQVRAATLMAAVQGRLLRYCRSSWRKKPTVDLAASVGLLLA